MSLLLTRGALAFIGEGVDLSADPVVLAWRRVTGDIFGFAILTSISGITDASEEKTYESIINLKRRQKILNLKH